MRLPQRRRRASERMLHERVAGIQLSIVRGGISTTEASRMTARFERCKAKGDAAI